MRRTPAVLCPLVAALLMAGAEPGAIIIRHDTPDAEYRQLAERYPAVGAFGRAGTGTLVADQWVLTAAHVAAGLRRDAVFTIGGRDYEIEKRVVHPDWKEMGPADVALLRLREPVRGITPLRIYEEPDEAGQSVVFVGFGGTGTGETGPQRPEDGLKRAATNVVDRADRDWLHFDFDAPATATALEGISGPGDSGGPAIVERNGIQFVAGVSVFGKPGLKGRGTYGAQEGYTRVSTVARWILSQLE